MKRNIYIGLLWVAIMSGGAIAQDAAFLWVKWERPEEIAEKQPAVFAPDPELLQAYGIVRWGRALQSLGNWYEVEVARASDIRPLMQALRDMPGTQEVWQSPEARSAYLPNDYDSTQLWQLAATRAPEAWDLARGKARTVIAVVDNAVLSTHEDLAPVLWTNPGEIPGNNIDDDGNGYIDDLHGWDAADGDGDPRPPLRIFRHGTHVAGTAAAATDNRRGIAAMGFGCSLMAVKVARDNGFADAYPFSTALKGVDYAINTGADIIVMAFGSPEYFPPGQALMEEAWRRGILLVAAAGNGPGDNNPATGDTTWQYPASFPHVLSVGATTRQLQKAAFATWNRRIDLCAPGDQIYGLSPSTTLNSSYTTLSGSSMAAPLVAGALGLLRSANPCLSADSVIAMLKASCSPLDSLNPAYAGSLGAGQLDAAALLQRLPATGAAPAASFALREDSAACGGRLQVFYTGQAGACPERWHWSLSNGQQSGRVNPVFTVAQSGSYTLRLRVENAFGADSAEQTLFVRAAAPPQAEAGPDQSLTSGDSVQLQAAGSGARYRWAPAAGLSDPNTLRPWAKPAVSTTYTLYSYSAAGCTATDSLRVIVRGVSVDAAETWRLPAPQWLPDQRIIQWKGVAPGSSGAKLLLVDLMGRTLVEARVLPQGNGSYVVEMPVSPTVANGWYMAVWELGQWRKVHKLRLQP